MAILTKGRKVCRITRTGLVCYTLFRFAWNNHKQSKHLLLKLPPERTKSKTEINVLSIFLLFNETNKLKRCKTLTVTNRAAMSRVAFQYNFPVLKFSWRQFSKTAYQVKLLSYRRGFGVHEGVMAIKRLPVYMCVTLNWVSAVVWVVTQLGRRRELRVTTTDGLDFIERKISQANDLTS